MWSFEDDELEFGERVADYLWTENIIYKKFGNVLLWYGEHDEEESGL